jgi:hypothetical protein
MNPKLLLRIAAVLMFLHMIGHTFGALSWKDAPNDAISRVITSMQTNHFEFMGRSVTIASFYEGYGFTMIGVLLLISLLLWVLSGETGNRLSARLLPFLAVFLLGMAIVEYLYFFLFAAMFSLLAGLCTGIAVFRPVASQATK